MKKITLLASIIAMALFTGCTKQPQPVAMNFYSPDGDKEMATGVSVTITQEMIDDVQKRIKAQKELKQQ